MKILKIILIVAAVVILIYGLIIIKLLPTFKMIRSDILESGYGYVIYNDTIGESYYVRELKRIDQLIKYYKVKVFKISDYKFADIKYFRRLPIDTKIDVRSYHKDSSVILFSHKIKTRYREDSIVLYGYAPTYIFHRMPSFLDTIPIVDDNLDK